MLQEKIVAMVILEDHLSTGLRQMQLIIKLELSAMEPKIVVQELQEFIQESQHIWSGSVKKWNLKNLNITNYK